TDQQLIRRSTRLVNSDLSILLALQDPQKDEKSTVEKIYESNSIKTLISAVADWDTNDHVALNPSRIAMRTKRTWFRKVGISGLSGAFAPIKGVLIDGAKAAETQKQLLCAFNWLLPDTDEAE